jgi:hypothetical protein
MEFDNEQKLDDFNLWSKHETNIKWIKGTKVTTYVHKIKGWCFSNFFLYYSMEPFRKFHQLNFL